MHRILLQMSPIEIIGTLIGMLKILVDSHIYF